MSTRFTQGGAGAVTASTLTAGVVEIATNAEAQAGVSTDKVITPYQLATYSGSVTGALVYRGAYDASTSLPDISNASKGDFYVISADGSIDGVAVKIGDHIVFKQDAGGTLDSSDFDVVDNSESTDILRDADIGTDIQAHATVLDSLSGLALNPGDLIKATAASTLTAVPSTDFQASSSTLSELGSLTAPAVDSVVQFTSAGTLNLIDQSTLGGANALDDLSDVSAGSPAPGDVLYRTGANWANVPLNAGNVSGLGTAAVLDYGSNAGNVVIYDINGDLPSIDALSDVALTNPADGHILVSDASGNFANEAPSAARTSLGLTIGTDVQAHDDTLDALSALTLSNGDLIKATGANTLTAVPSTDFQLSSPTLSDLGSLTTPAADSVVQFTSGGAINLIAQSTLGGANALDDLSDVALTNPAQNDFLVKSATDFVNQTPAQVRATLDLEVGTDVQAHDDTLDALSALTLSNGDLIKATGANTLTAVPSADFQLSSPTLSDLGSLTTPAADSVVQFTSGGAINLIAQSTLVSPTANTTTAGIVELADNTEADAAAAADRALTPANISSIRTSALNNDEGFISDITAENLVDLSDVAFSNLQSGEFLKYDGANWVNGTGARPTIAVASSGADLVEFKTNFFAAGSSVNYVDIPSSPSDGDEFDLYFHDNQSIDLHMAAGSVSLFVRGIAHTISTNLSGTGYTLHAKRGDYYRIKFYNTNAYLYSLSADRLASTTLLANGASYPADAFTIGEVNGTAPDDPLGVIDYMEGHRTYVVNAVSGSDQGAGNFTITLPTPNDAGSTQGASGQARFGFMVTIKRVGDLDVIVVPAAGTTIDIDVPNITLTSDNDSVTLMAVGPNNNQWYVINKDIASTGGGGGSRPALYNVNASTTIGSTNPIGASELERIYIVDSSSAVTMTLPQITGNVGDGYKINIKRNGNNNVTITANAADDIEGGSAGGSVTLAVDKSSFTLVVDTTNTRWHII